MMLADWRSWPTRQGNIEILSTVDEPVTEWSMLMIAAEGGFMMVALILLLVVVMRCM
jgi:hypothetical protein